MERQPRDQESEKNGDARIKDCPAEPERQFSEIDRITRERVRGASQQIFGGPFPLPAFRSLDNVPKHCPDYAGDSGHDPNQPEQIPTAWATLRPPITAGEQREMPLN